VAVAPNGHVWFDVLQGSRLYEVDPRTDSVRIHELSEPPPPGDPWGHYAFRDSTGRWQTRMLRSAADTMALDAERRRTVQQNRLRALARRMTIDGRGQIWVSDYGRDRVLRYDPATQTMRAFTSPVMASRPYGIMASESGHIVFNETRANLVVALDPVSGQRSSIAIPTAGATVRHLAIDEKRLRVWLPLSDRGRLGLLRFAR
jgi:streptogramin lyase